MYLPYDPIVRDAILSEGLTEKEPFTFYYPGSSVEKVFLPTPDEDGNLDTGHVLQDIALYDAPLSERIGRRLAEALGVSVDSL